MVLTETEVFRRAISDYGKVPQKIKAIEELAELINALSIGNINMITEEMADVSIMLAQLEMIYNNSIEVQGYRSDKLKRPPRKIKPIEELSKLIQVIAKNSDLCLVAEKMADVYLVLERLKVKHRNAQDVDIYRQKKLERLDFRLLRLEELEPNVLTEGN
jgi:hypothetical protein